MPDTFYTADPHFGDEVILDICKRPFPNTLAMDEVIIQNWNAIVKPEDIVILLGDTGHRCSLAHLAECLSALNGRKRVVRGNHDQDLDFLFKLSPTRRWLHRLVDSPLGRDLGIVDIQDYLEATVDGQLVVISHFPFETWRHDIRGAWHLHGHVHGLPLRPNAGKRMDVGLDACGFRPVNHAQVEAIMDATPLGNHPFFPGYVPQAAS